MRSKAKSLGRLDLVRTVGKIRNFRLSWTKMMGRRRVMVKMWIKALRIRMVIMETHPSKVTSKPLLRLLVLIWVELLLQIRIEFLVTIVGCLTT